MSILREGRCRASAAHALALAALAAWASPAAAEIQAEVVYGRDNRVETYTLRGARAQNAAASVALVATRDIKSNGDGTSTLVGPSLRESQALCPGQRFAAQPTPPFCSGVLLGPTVVATAGHCVADQAALADMRFVFDFAMIDAKRARTTLPNHKIYRGKRLLARQLDDSNGNDYAVVELDRPVTDREPATLERTGKIAKGTTLYVIGYPNGLPAKFAGGAWVQQNADPIYFEANLDTFGGNSGSPVFSKQTHRVVGLLVRGDADYAYDSARGCYVVNTETDSSGSEDVTRSTVFAPFVPKR